MRRAKRDTISLLPLCNPSASCAPLSASWLYYRLAGLSRSLPYRHYIFDAFRTVYRILQPDCLSFFVVPSQPFGGFLGTIRHHTTIPFRPWDLIPLLMQRTRLSIVCVYWSVHNRLIRCVCVCVCVCVCLLDCTQPRNPALSSSKEGSMIFVTKTSGQTRQRNMLSLDFSYKSSVGCASLPDSFSFSR